MASDVFRAARALTDPRRRSLAFAARAAVRRGSGRLLSRRRQAARAVSRRHRAGEDRGAGGRGAGSLPGRRTESRRSWRAWRGVASRPRASTGTSSRSSGTAERITIEPGGQVEFPGAARATAAACRDALRRPRARGRRRSARPLGIRFLGVGARPFGKIDDVDWLPKRALRRDARLLLRATAQIARLAHHMMKMTATVQANFDYESESDAVDKIADRVRRDVDRHGAVRGVADRRGPPRAATRASAPPSGWRPTRTLRAAAVRVRAGLFVSSTTSSGRWTCPMLFVVRGDRTIGTQSWAAQRLPTTSRSGASWRRGSRARRRRCATGRFTCRRCSPRFA